MELNWKISKAVLSLISCVVLLTLLMAPEVSATILRSPNGELQAKKVQIGKVSHYHVANVASGKFLFSTTAQFTTPNDVKAGIFSHDSQQFAAAYHYEHDGKYTWVGIWNVNSGQRIKGWVTRGWVLLPKFPFEVLDTILNLNKPDLSKVGISLLPELTGYPSCVKRKGREGECTAEQYVTEEEYEGMRHWPQIIPWGGLWNHAPQPVAGSAKQYEEEPTETRKSAQALARSIIKHENRFLLDLEPPEFHQLSNEAQWHDAIRIMKKVIRDLRLELPQASLGYWSILPQSNFWVQVQKARQDLVSLTASSCVNPADKTVECDYRNWKRQNQLFESLANEVDIVYPRLYTDYKEKCQDNFARTYPAADPKGSQGCAAPASSPSPTTDPNAWFTSRQGWQAYAESTIQAARKYNKPVYAFLWPQFRENFRCETLESVSKTVYGIKVDLTSKSRYEALPIGMRQDFEAGAFDKLTLTKEKFQTLRDKASVEDFFANSCREPGREGRMNIPGDYWRMQLETAYRLADGIVIWDYAWDPPNPKLAWQELVTCDQNSKPLLPTAPDYKERVTKRNHWWHVTLEFLAEKGLSDLEVHQACQESLKAQKVTDNVVPNAPENLKIIAE